MAERTQIQSSYQPEPSEDPQPVEASAPNVQPIDSVLDQIDSILEENTQDFVNAFVQKGGQ